ncbi:hypothetical protein BRYFOR_06798 [Marvinbryantia formatexigens DSM 14469]|uniref:Efflux ABC transporter, permease protein n=1 Tax=Marvinbryantia formatexigens DSM 14469 TaxID=478749 RepID=C6LDU9_9FIRM|nr:FtsX-like permease family protein [Marvinbryantia formatexigens]EET61153.1 hypothetical protein BRYFOR_06798 [Marvinbryantia formatexigens DSM 14469]UWO23725.1 ABC transporter permease [Marvinbryantia formatexigens DSM 14469]SDF68024.1 putative ABC transport system permease protein [Marvinbryantia formatexigens]
MKSYLELIPVSARAHRKQTRMTRLCITISVFLIAALFGMADMFLRSQKNQAIQSDGAWHAAFKLLDEEQLALLGARPEVKGLCRYAATNYRLDMEYEIGETRTVLCGFDETFFELFPGIHLSDGNFPRKENEALVTESVRDSLQLSAGDTVEMTTPEGTLSFCVSGFVEDTSNLLKGGAFGVFVNMDTYFVCFGDATLREDVVCYVEFKSGCRIQKALDDICGQLDIPRDAVSENAKLMGLLLQSRNNYIMALYMAAAILAVLVAFAGMLMILGSLNSNVAQRTEFFGMMRCIGATKTQVKRFVRLEALLWCRTAIPAGIAGSMVIIWILCGILKRVSPTYFGEMPDFGISLPGIAAGLLIGLLTVLAASGAPAKKAARVSPLAAVSGNAGTVFAAKRAADTRILPVEAALGIHHATGSKKNLLLLTASFAFSIILFLCFGTGVDFMQHALTPLRPYTPDVSVVSRDNGCDIPDSLSAALKENPAVKRVFGRSFAYDLPVTLQGEEKKVNLISYETFQFGWAEGDLLEGSMESAENGEGVLLVKKEGFPAETGMEIELQTENGVQKVTIAGVLSYAPFDGGDETGILICSEDLFRQLTGETGYTILDIQLEDKSDSAVDEIRSLAGNGYTFSDQRMSNQEVRALYYSFSLFVYGFLAIIALIAVFNIINSIGMSVSARMRQYGAMRAIGTSIRQLGRMIAAETVTYLFCGLLLGLAAGLPLHYLLYTQIITGRWGDAWSAPVPEFGFIALVMVAAAAAAIAGPMRRIRRMSVSRTIRAQ